MSSAGILERNSDLVLRFVARSKPSAEPTAYNSMPEQQHAGCPVRPISYMQQGRHHTQSADCLLRNKQAKNLQLQL